MKSENASKRSAAKETTGRKSRVAQKPDSQKSTGRRYLTDEIVQRIVEDFIVSGQVPEGERLPSEADLCEKYKVSRVTTRAAIRTLWDQGIISVRNGVGAIVLPRANEMRHGLDRLASIDTFARETGRDIKTDHLNWETLPADADASRKLQIPVDAPVLHVSRSKSVDGTVIAWIVDVVPLTAVDEKQIKEEFDGSVLDVLLADSRYNVDYADSEVKPCLSQGKIKEIVGGDENGLLLYLDTVTVTTAGNPILWGQIWLNPSQFRFSFHRRRFR